MGQVPLLQSKLYLPPIQPDLVLRPREGLGIVLLRSNPTETA
jgi:hypothetical protein